MFFCYFILFSNSNWKLFFFPPLPVSLSLAAVFSAEIPAKWKTPFRFGFFSFLSKISFSGFRLLFKIVKRRLFSLWFYFISRISPIFSFLLSFHFHSPYWCPWSLWMVVVVLVLVLVLLVLVVFEDDFYTILYNLGFLLFQGFKITRIYLKESSD